ncbi:MAG: PAS domain-containing sensor histidine kinase [Sphingobacteriales bacterium]|nr:MAG: PAS domain-containing sensor histidine kinase [Sphingobacteriales bacterium]
MDELLADAPCGFLICNDEGFITEANNTIGRMLSMAPSELRTMKFEALLTIAGRIFYQTHLFPLMRLHGKAEEIFLTLRNAEKQDIPVLVNAVRKEKDNEAQYHMVLLPVYERKKFEQELLQARKAAEDALFRNEHLQAATRDLEKHKIELDRQLSRLQLVNKDLLQFSNAISHDMQEPVRKIAMFADIIERENNKELSDVSKVSLGKIKYSSRRMRDLITSLEQFVMVNAGADHFRDCDLQAVVGRARLKAMIDTGDHSLGFTSDNLPVIEGQCEQIELLFYHLFLNSIRFKQKDIDPAVTITTDIIQQNSFRSLPDKYMYTDFLRLRYQDNGSGFNPEYKEYIFQLFKKAQINDAGLGMGLALCRKIAEHHYGSITAASEPGQGATFTILLPLRQLMPNDKAASVTEAAESVENNNQ